MLDVANLSISFKQYTKGLRQRSVPVLHDLHLSVKAGEIVAVVGSSGSGKSLLAHAILGILPANAAMTGSIQYEGGELTKKRQKALCGREIVLVPQSVSFLDPLMRVGSQVRASVKSGNSMEKQRKAFERFGLKREVERMFPYQLSGGMARRVLVSTAAVSDAKLIIADEPTPGLHMEVVEEALHSFRRFADGGASVMLITHDIPSALTVADRVAVLYAGTVVEIADASDFEGGGGMLRHPYSKALWKALPQNGFVPTAGSQPSPDELSEGCLFAPRCGMATRECEHGKPKIRSVRGGIVRCIHAT